MVGEVTALALVVAFSPISVLPAIALIVHSERPRPTGLAFICGWLAGKAAITTLFVGVPRLLEGLNGLDGPAPHWTGWARVAAGVVCIAAGLAYWRRPMPAATGPRWVERIKHLTPAAAAAIGVSLTVLNPKVVFACAAAGFAIGTAALSSTATVASVVYFTAVAGSTAALPILAYMLWSHRVDRALDRFNSWLRRNQRAITSVVLLALGVALLVNGGQAL